MRNRWLALAGVAVAPLLLAPDAARSFEVVSYEEATIADIHAALNAKTLTCRALVQIYLDRIAAYDKKGPALNAIVVTNPDGGNCSELRVPIGARLGNGGDGDVMDHPPFIPAALIVDDEQRGNVSEDIVKGTRICWIGRKPRLGFQHDADGADRG